MTTCEGVVGILLAAGSARRFGSNKLQARLQNGERIGLQSARNLIDALPAALVIIRSEADAAGYEALGLRAVLCPDASRGMGMSLACGIRAAGDAIGYCIALADMPFIERGTISAVVQAMLRTDCIAAPAYKGTRGHPVIFPCRYRTALLALTDDCGAQSVIANERPELLDISDSGVMRDIDTRADLLQFDGQ